MIHYLEKRKEVIGLIKAGSIAEAKRVLREEIASLKYLKKSLRDQYKSNGRMERSMDEGAKHKMALYHRELQFHMELQRKIRGFEKKLKQKMR